MLSVSEKYVTHPSLTRTPTQISHIHLPTRHKIEQQKKLQKETETKLEKTNEM